MNTDSTLSMARQLMTSLATAWAVKHGVDGDLAGAAVGGLFALASFGWSVYAHWDMIKVPAK